MNMNYALVIAGIIVLVGLGVFFFMRTQTQVPPLDSQTATTTQNENRAELSPVTVTPIAHASTVLHWEGQTIVVDPVGDAALFAGAGEPDMILITDIHGDHLSTSTLSSVMATNTRVIAPQAVADLLPDTILEKTTVMENGEKITLGGFAIEAMPMYNLPQNEDSPHVKGRGNGYVLERDGTRVYIAGDTADIPEMRALKDIDIAFIPMNLPYTMGIESAANGVLAFAPRTVYPYHYRTPEGFSDVARFKELVNEGNGDIDVLLLEWYPTNE